MQGGAVMTRACHVTPGRTAERVEKIRRLLTALQAGQPEHDEVGAVLGMGPSGVRKYLFDLRTLVAREGHSVRLSAGVGQVEDFLHMLGKQGSPRCASKAPAGRPNAPHSHHA